MKRTAKNLLIIIFAVLILELFVFNVKFWLTVSNDTIRYNNADIELGPGIIYDSNTDKYTIVDPNQSYISFVNVNRHINSIDACFAACLRAGGKVCVWGNLSRGTELEGEGGFILVFVKMCSKFAG